MGSTNQNLLSNLPFPRFNAFLCSKFHFHYCDESVPILQTLQEVKNSPSKQNRKLKKNCELPCNNCCSLRGICKLKKKDVNKKLAC